MEHPAYAYDTEGNLASVTAPGGGISAYSYDALGRQTLVLQGNGASVATTYDAVGNILTITHKDASNATIAQYIYAVDDANRRTQKVETLPQGGFTTTYTYDLLDRLTKSLVSDGTETNYVFDDAGNRTAQYGTQLVNGTPETYSWTFGYNAANQLKYKNDGLSSQTTYTYNEDGNRIGTTGADARMAFTYDAESHLLTVHVELWDGSNWTHKGGVYESYAYDGDTRRVQKNSWLVSDNTLVDQLTYRYDDTKGWDVLQTYASQTERFLYDNSLHKLAYWQDAESGYFMNEGLGSVVGSTSATGSVVAPDGLMRYGDYGERIGSETALPTADGFTGYEGDAYTGLEYARNRYYDTETGTFLASDPYPNQKEAVGSLNRYLYVQANPINYTDPLGWFKWTSVSTGIIERGDTLWGIAAKYWGVSVYDVNWNMISAIQGFNSWIRDPNLIYVGYTLKLPTPLSAYQYLVYSSDSAISSSTSESDCGQKPPAPTPPGTPPTTPPGTPPTNPPTTPPVQIIDETKSSSAWNFYKAILDGLLNGSELKVTNKKFSNEIPSVPTPVYIPPIVVIGYPGGIVDAQFKWAVNAKIYRDSSKIVPNYYSTGWCGEIYAEGKLEVSIPLWGPLRVGAWGGLNGAVGACTEGKWISQNQLKIYLKGHGYIGGEIGAKLYVQFGLGSIDVETGVKGGLYGQLNLSNASAWAKAEAYLEAQGKLFGLKWNYEWHKTLFETQKKTWEWKTIFH